MKNILKSNGKLLYGIVVLSVMLLSVSYGIFVITSSDYKASELMVGDLLYGITIHDTDKVLQSNPVTVSTGDTTLYITIASVNSITSKYTLAYNNSNVSVSASNKSGWNASGSMSNFQDYAYTKTVKVVVTNNTGTNQTVTFAAFGGYSYNSAANIPLGNGYYTVANFTDVINVSGELLTDIVEEDTNCSSSNCLYGGEATTNYFSFEENGDLYRILGTYTIDNEKITKIAANDLVQTTTPTNLNTTLSTIANTLNTDYIYNTNLFNCQGTTSITCTSYNNFNSNIGILSLDEYRGLEGDNENNYLYNSNSYYLLSNNTLVTNTNQTETPTSAYIRPTLYLTDEAKVAGSGTVSDPYILEEEADFNLVAIMVEQTEGEGDYSSANNIPTGDYTFNSSNSYCTVNGTIDNTITLSYDDSTGALTILPISSVGTKCYLYFDIQTLDAITTAMIAASRGTVSSYAAIASGDTANSGVYQTNLTDDNSMVYFYRGNVQNNWVRFGNNGNGTCYYWRVIRTNTTAEGGGVRLLYAGSSTSCSGSVPTMTNAYINGTTYYYATSDAQYNNSSYSGYMFDVGSPFGHGSSSYAKQVIDSWYTSSGLSNFASSINENAIYCSDRSTTNGQSWSATGSAFSYDGAYRAGKIYNGSWVDTTVSPTLKCTNSEDKFSKGTGAGGNGYLGSPIAMMTSDELVLAGAYIWQNSYAYYYYASDGSSSATGSTYWWTMSPFVWNGSYASVFYVSGSNNPGYLVNSGVSGACGLRPVVSLSSSASVSGSGTVADPYVVS